MDVPGSTTLAAILGAALGGVAVGLGCPPDPVDRLRVVGRARSAGRSAREPAGGRARSAGEGAPEPVVTDLVAAALLTGLPPGDAVTAVADALHDGGDPAAAALRAVAGRGRDPAGRAPGFASLTEALDLAARTGLGPVPLVQAAAGESRRRRAARRQVAARRLGTLVVLPVGLCLLPAFVLLTVAPLVLDLLLG
jgi:hypothetical protein